MSLILTRKPGETIVCTTAEGQQVLLTVTAVKGNQVRIAVEADKSVSVDREEIAKRKAAGHPRPAS